VKRKWIALGIGITVLILAAHSPGYSQGQPGKCGFGLFVDYLVPTLNFNSWHKPAPEFGGNLSYRMKSDRTMVMEFEYHYAKFNHGRVEKKAFIWAVNKQSVTSPNARNFMTMNSGIINTLLYLGSRKSESTRKAFPYVAVGTGFYNYVNKTTGLIYPGQKAEPLKTTLILEPREDANTSFGVSLGIGTEIKMGTKTALDLRGRYHMIFGHLNPMETWGIKEVFPIQIVDIRVAMRFYL
jgi:hypothetical protein